MKNQRKIFKLQDASSEKRQIRANVFGMKLKSVLLFGILSFVAWSCAEKISGPKGADGSFDLGEYDVAIGAYEKMLEDNPNDPRVNFRVAESYRRVLRRLPLCPHHSR